VVTGGHQRCAAHPANGDAPLAILGGLGSVGWVQRALGLGDGAEELVHQSERLGLVDTSRDQEHGVVGLVILPVEGLKPGDVDMLDVALGPDGVLSVVMPVERHRLNALEGDIFRVILTGFELIADHRHLRVEVLPGDEAVHHPVRFEFEGRGEVRLARWETDEVIGAVEPGTSVGPTSEGRQRLCWVRVRRRPLEKQVLEQVGHARLAVVLLPRADEVSEVDRHRRLGRVGKQKHPKAVGQPVLGDSLDLGDSLRGR
jgi:hypothetical protein